jgi:16S rRNA (guanine527-N7)-methyltransferase
VSEAELAARIRSRAGAFGVSVSQPVAAALVEYLRVLTRWNRRINLTSLPLEPLSEKALDRLVVEPLVAAQHIPGSATSLMDVGSGAGSPAIPLKLMRPDLRLVLVEARSRKAAFLRETVRMLRLSDTSVLTARAENLGQMIDRSRLFDCVTVRAVRLDEALVGALRGLIHPGGLLYFFTSSGVRPSVKGLELHASWPLAGRAELAAYRIGHSS